MFDQGSEIIRADFHLHTRKDKEFKYAGEEHSFVSEYVEALYAQHIRIGVITNHNKFDFGEYKALRSCARKREIFILPGVELSVKEGASGLHTLIVFDPETWLSNGDDDINHFLDSAFIGISNRENANTRCRCDLPAMIDLLDGFGKDYFVVFAHVDQKNGLFEECSNGMLTSLASEHKLSRRVRGLQKVRNYARFKSVPSYWNQHLAMVEGSDPKALSDIGKEGSCCYIKIGDYSFGAVKYALEDYTNRVFSTSPVIRHGYIKSISFEGGRLSGQRISFSASLNTVIGIRGSGKSSLLEVVRYALSLFPSQDADYKNDLVKHVLGDGGKISMTVIDEHGIEYHIERIYGERPVVLTAEGKVLPIAPNAILKNPLYFGQKDLSMSKPGYEFELLNKLVGGRINKQEEKLEQIVSSLQITLRQYAGIRALPERIRELEDKDKEYDHKLQVFKDRGITERLAKQTAYRMDIAKLSTIIKSLTTVIDSFQVFVDKYDTSGVQLEGYQSKFNEAIFCRANELIQSINAHVAMMVEQSRAIESDKTIIEGLLQNLQDANNELREEFAQIKREIADDTIDLDGFEKYQAEQLSCRASIEQERRRLGSMENIKQALAEGFHERNKLLQQTFLAYQEEINSINCGQSELEIRIEFKGDKRLFITQLKNAFKGTRLTDAKYQQIAKEFSDMPAIIEDYYLNDGKKLKEQISEREFAAIAERIEADYESLIENQCPDMVHIYYHGKELGKHSMGQRASALMLFILSQDDNEIIIIDQPEDDLDNQVVYTEFIKTLKQKKTGIQFIFATHNANIPVLGDTERLIAAQYTDSNIGLTTGNIDTPLLQRKIVEIMEGGFEAFQRRNAIYTSWR